MSVLIFIWAVFVSLSMWQYHEKIQHIYHFDGADTKILSRQIIAYLIFFLTLPLAIGSIIGLNNSSIFNSLIWVVLTCISLVYIGISSIMDKVSVFRLRLFDPPKGNLAVLFGTLSIILAVIFSLTYGRQFFEIFK